MNFVSVKSGFLVSYLCLFSLLCVSCSSVQTTLSEDDSPISQLDSVYSYSPLDVGVQAGDGIVVLSWENPIDSAFEKVIIRRSDSGPISGYDDGDVVYQGTAEIFTDDTVSNNIQYYYGLYAVDILKNYSSIKAVSTKPSLKHNVSPRFLDDAEEPFLVNENYDFVTTISAEDDDGDAVLFTISGADSAFFKLQSRDRYSVDLYFKQLPDYELVLADRENVVYEFTISVSDNMTLISQLISVVIVDLFEPETKEALIDGLVAYVDADTVAACGDINTWDTSKIKNMSNLFKGKTTFNCDISAWNVANVTDMSSMFEEAAAFNQNISAWNVANVTDMSSMFYRAEKFNHSISAWNLGNVTDMSSMFSNATAFNQNISAWNVANVMDMESMFSNATAFNQNINAWNVANVIDMESMFKEAAAFNQNISAWNVGNVTNMKYMFFNAKAFNQNISAWNVGNVTNMKYMFFLAEAFNQNISAWNVVEVTECGYFSSDLTESNRPNFSDCE